MIIKCTTCSLPMTESKKNKPENIPPQNKWILCRKCNNGVEVIGGNDAPAATGTVPAGNATSMSYEETTYITIEQTDKGIIKSRYSDKEHKNLIGEEKLG